jgi:hypothetical protein
MHAFQSSMPCIKDRMIYKEQGEQKVSLTMMILVYNLRARMVGINQLNSVYKGALNCDANIDFVLPLLNT